MIDAAGLRALLAKATPGPWRVSSTGYSVKSDDPDVPIVATPWNGPKVTEKQFKAWLENASLFSAAVNALPALLAERDRLLAVVEAATAADESRAARQKLDAEGYRLPTPEWERLQDLAYEHVGRMDALRDALRAAKETP